MRIAMTGSTGLIGSVLTEELTKKGHSVTPIIRSSTPLKSNRKVIRWNIDLGKIDTAGLEGQDAVIHLSGASLAGERWTPKYKALIRESRLKSTSFLATSLAQLKNPPRVFLSASAVGYYGEGEEKKDEASPRGTGFLADLCYFWELATEAAEHRGIRVVHLRFGMVLSKKGGALGKMLSVFKMGLGGKIGSGKQMMNWIVAQEIPEIVLHVIETPSLRGPLNVVAPEALSNEEFTRTLGKALRRPTIFPLPAKVAQMMFGEMADSLLLSSSYVVPKRLLETGYQFSYPTLSEALAKVLSS